MKRIVILTVLFSFLILLAVPAFAEDTRLSISNCTVITRPGSYVLAKGITATQRDLRTMAGSNPSCILILADFVSLDLQGYTIVGPGSGFGIYSNISATNRIATHVRNGAVTNFERGIALEGYAHTAERVRVVGNGAGLTFDGGAISVEEVLAYANGEGILCFGGSGHSVSNSEVRSSTGNGINLVECPGSRVVGNTVSGNGGSGIVAKCPSVIVQNVAFENAGGDIVADPDACTRSDNNPAP